MNHLGCDGNMKVVFDAGDAKLEASDEDDQDDQDEADEIGTRIDLCKLRGEYCRLIMSQRLATYPGGSCSSLLSRRP